jgi:hypothetical protein
MIISAITPYSCQGACLTRNNNFSGKKKKSGNNNFLPSNFGVAKGIVLGSVLGIVFSLKSVKPDISDLGINVFKGIGVMITGLFVIAQLAKVKNQFTN